MSEIYDRIMALEKIVKQQQEIINKLLTSYNLHLKPGSAYYVFVKEAEKP